MGKSVSLECSVKNYMNLNKSNCNIAETVIDNFVDINYLPKKPIHGINDLIQTMSKYDLLIDFK